MPETFECPACGAPQAVPAEPGLSSIRCLYCGQAITIPEDLRTPFPEPQPEEPATTLVVNMHEVVPRAASRIGILITCGVLAVILLAGAMVGLSFFAAQKSASSTVNVAESLTGTAQANMSVEALATQFVLTQPTEAGLASVALQFGQQGEGAGQFLDLRHVAVDGQGRIYTGQQEGGRIQVFDPQGNFITQWMIEADFPLAGLAVSRDGHVYILQRGRIRVHDGLSGELLGTLDYEAGFDDVFVTLNGNLLTAFDRQMDEVLRFDADGQVLLSIPAAVSGQTGRSELQMHVTESGNGTIYALGTFNNAVFVYDAQGNYVNRFGSRGSEPGQFQWGNDIVVDGQGRVYVSEVMGVQVFSSDGRFLGSIDVEGAASGLAVDSEDNLYVAARTQVIKYKIP